MTSRLCTAAPLLTDAHCTVLLVLCWLMYIVQLVLCCLMYRCSSADWCTAAPVLTDVLLDSAGPLLIYVLLVLCSLMHCTAGSLLLDAPLVLCCLLPCQPATDWCNDAMCVILLKWPGLFTEFLVNNRKCPERFTKYSPITFSVEIQENISKR